jgi:hypothetical protein
MVLYTNEQLPRENYVFEIRIRDLRTKPKKRDSLPQCFVSRNMKHPGKYAGLFRETKRRRKSCFVSVVSLPTCFNSGPKQGQVTSQLHKEGPQLRRVRYFTRGRQVMDWRKTAADLRKQAQSAASVSGVAANTALFPS